MRFSAQLFLSLLLSGLPICFGRSLPAQTTNGPYHLVATVDLPEVRGGFDHFAYDPAQQRLYLAASDNGSVEVIDVKGRQRLTSLSGFTSPHSVLVRPKSHQILVTDSGPHASALLESQTLKKRVSLRLALGANCILLNPDNTRLYVTAGGDRVGQTYSVLQMINPDTGIVLRSVTVPAIHLQPMDIDIQHRRLFVNIADQDAIGIFDSNTLKRVGTWPLPEGHRNSPIVFDRLSQSLFVIATDPGILMQLNADSGAMRTAITTPANPDDMGFDPAAGRLFVPGEGAMEIYQLEPRAPLRLLERIETGQGARTGIFLADSGDYAVAIPASIDHPAQVRIYGTEK